MENSKTQSKAGQEVHVYDGIVEHDNFLPRWWLATLYGTIVFSFLYFMHYTFGPGTSILEAYENSAKQHRLLQAQAASTSSFSGSGGGSDPQAQEEALRVWATSAEHVGQGKSVYDAKCAVCHGNVGQGGIGPNLTDDYWIHGNRRVQIAAVIAQGVGDKGMPPWGALLKDDELKSVVAYVRTLHGTSPAGAKAPQGEKVAME